MENDGGAMRYQYDDVKPSGAMRAAYGVETSNVGNEHPRYGAGGIRGDGMGHSKAMCTPGRGRQLVGMTDAEICAHMNHPQMNAPVKAGYEMNPNPYKHGNKLGEGAKARAHIHGKAKIPVVMHEFKRGTLHSGSGAIVTNPKQAVAIALHEAGMSKKKKKG